MKRTINTSLCKAEGLQKGDIFIFENDIHTVLDFTYSIACIDILVSKYESPFNDNGCSTFVYIPKLCDVETIDKTL
jgi:hypothetical protein